LVKVVLYVEGGGDTRALQAPARQGMQQFLTLMGYQGKLPKVVFCGGRSEALRDFSIAQQKAGSGTEILLLVDSEGPLPPQAKPSQYLGSRDGWSPPNNVSEENIHFMVQVMESWFLTQTEVFTAHFGGCLQRSRLPGVPPAGPEGVAKATMLKGVADAAADCPKGYEKRRDGFELLGKLQREPLETKCPYAQRFLKRMDSLLG
jgi:hypothetical protein